MHIVTLDQINQHLEIDKVRGAVKQAFIEHHQGSIHSPTPMQLLFNDTQGNLTADCHVKAAKAENQNHFVIKVASGFYNNSQNGLPVNNGLTLLFNQETGQPEVLLQDEGWLTAFRTAAAGALAAGLAKPKTSDCLGIIGSGLQAELQAIWACHHLGLEQVMIYARSGHKAKQLIETLATLGLTCTTANTPQELATNCRVVITTTPSTSAVISYEDLLNTSATHIVALGADSPGKQELDAEILVQADVIITDDYQQCYAHGELSHAVNITNPSNLNLVSLGDALQKGATFSQLPLSVVDLTGLGAQDLAMASVIWESVKSHTQSPIDC